MQIHKKATFILLALIIIFFIGFLAVWSVNKRQFSLLEKDRSRQLNYFLDKALELKDKPVVGFVYDYTFWDEMVSFVLSADLDWAHKNIDPSLRTFDADAVWVFSKELSLVYSTDVFGRTDTFSLPFPVLELKKIFKDKNFAHFFVDSPLGLLELHAATIHSTDDVERKSPPQGYFVAGHLWDDEYLKEISHLLNGSAMILSPNELTKTKDAFARFSLQIYRQLKDWQGSTVRLLRLNVPMDFSRQFSHTFTLLLGLYILCAGILMIILFFSFFYWITSPLKKISLSLEKENAVFLAGIDGQDNEFGEIAKAVNRFLKQKRELVHEITERKVAEQRLRVEEEKYRTIVENSAVAITVTDENERITSWNKFAEALLGMTADDLRMLHVSKLYPPQEWQKIRGYNLRAKGAQHHFDTQMVCKNGGIIDVIISLSVLKDEESKVIGSIGIIRDVTSRKAAERALHQTMEMKAQFASMVSHELRTPLTAIRESLNIILEAWMQNKLSDEHKEFMTIAQRNVERLNRLIDDVLDFNKLQANKMQMHIEEGDFNQCVSEVHRAMLPLARSKGLDLILNPDQTIPKVRFDKDRIIQVLTNLVNNAIKFTDEGSVTISTVKEDGVVHVAVIDTGIGIQAEDFSKLFTSFGQLGGKERRVGGTGLGLAICKEIIEQHKGKAWAESVYGQGSSFHFTIPVTL